MNARMLMWYATSLVAIAMIVNLYMLFYMRCGQEPFFSDGKKTFESRIASAKMLGSSEYSVVEYPNFLSGAECARIIKVARESGKLKQAETLDAKTDNLSSYNPNSRTSKTVFVDDSIDAVVGEVADAAARLTRKSLKHQEMMQVAMYEPGGKFDEHYDACDAEPDVCVRFNRGSSNRLATLLIYLNDDYEGGDTVFTRVTPHIRVRPKTGKAVLFYDTNPEDDQIIKESMHRGSEVLSGEKWICTKWVHTSPWLG